MAEQKSSLVKALQGKTRVLKKLSKNRNTSRSERITDGELAESLGIGPGETVTVEAKLSAVRTVDRTANEGGVSVVFNFTTTSTDSPLQCSKWQNLISNDGEFDEEGTQRLYYDLQTCGYDTDDYGPQEIEDACKELTRIKPKCLIAIKARRLDQGKNKGQIRCNIYLNRLLSDETSSSEPEKTEPVSENGPKRSTSPASSQEELPEVSVGDRCIYAFDGEEYMCEVTKLNGDGTCELKDDEGYGYEQVPIMDLVIENPEE